MRCSIERRRRCEAFEGVCAKFEFGGSGRECPAVHIAITRNRHAIERVRTSSTTPIRPVTDSEVDSSSQRMTSLSSKVVIHWVVKKRCLPPQICTFPSWSSLCSDCWWVLLAISYFGRPIRPTIFRRTIPELWCVNVFEVRLEKERKNNNPTWIGTQQLQNRVEYLLREIIKFYLKIDHPSCYCWNHESSQLRTI